MGFDALISRSGLFRAKAFSSRHRRWDYLLFWSSHHRYKRRAFWLEFSNAFGVSLALFSTVLWSVYWIINSKSKSDAVVGLFCNFFVGVVFIVVYIIFTGGVALPSLKGAFAAVYVGFFEMGVTFVFWLKAVSLAQNVSKVSNLIFLSPFYLLSSFPFL